MLVMHAKFHPGTGRRLPFARIGRKFKAVNLGEVPPIVGHAPGERTEGVLEKPRMCTWGARGGGMELPLPFPAGPASAGDATQQKTSSMPLRVQEQHGKFQKRRIVCRKRRRIALAAEPFRQRPNLQRFWSMRDPLCVKSTISPCRGGIFSPRPRTCIPAERRQKAFDPQRYIEAC